MGLVRPVGVKIVIVVLLFSIVLTVGANLFLLFQVGKLQEPFYVSLVNSVLLVVAAVGLWRMRRWGLWLTIALSAFGFVSSCYATFLLATQAHQFVTLPMPWILFNFDLLFLWSNPARDIISHHSILGQRSKDVRVALLPQDGRTSNLVIQHR